MKLTVPSFPNGGPIPAEFAMGIPATDGPAAFGPNRSPHVIWSDVPEGTQSLALIFVDGHAPAVGDHVNKPDVTVPHALPRVDFYHWVLVDIPVALGELTPGLDSEGVTPGGKRPSRTSYGVRGVNSYTGWFAADPDMAGQYGGYDGPFPPWNDERIHSYELALYALSVPTLGLEENFSGDDALAAIRGNSLATATWTGTYAIYEDARPA